MPAPRGWLIDEEPTGARSLLSIRRIRATAPYHDAWRDGDWWTVRGYDKVFGRKLPALFERCVLEDVPHAATTEVVRGASPWARWRSVTLKSSTGGAIESYRRELDVITAALANPTVSILRELLHACWDRRGPSAN